MSDRPDVEDEDQDDGEEIGKDKNETEEVSDAEYEEDASSSKGKRIRQPRTAVKTEKAAEGKGESPVRKRRNLSQLKVFEAGIHEWRSPKVSKICYGFGFLVDLPS